MGFCYEFAILIQFAVAHAASPSEGGRYKFTDLLLEINWKDDSDWLLLGITVFILGALTFMWQFFNDIIQYVSRKQIVVN